MEFTEEHKRRIAEAVKASWTPERREDQRQKRLGVGNPFYGKKHKDRAKHGRSGTENSFYGKKHDESVKTDLSEKHKGRAHRLYRHGISDEQYAQKLSEGFLWCSGHKDFLPREQFLSNRGTILQRCRICCRRRQIEKCFGVSLEWFEQKFAEQNYHCAICDCDASDEGRHLSIDHDHETGALRGILCTRCNNAIERFDSIPNWAQKVEAYLNVYRSPSP